MNFKSRNQEDIRKKPFTLLNSLRFNAQFQDISVLFMVSQ